MTKGPRVTNGEFDLAETPSHLIRRIQQFHGDLFAREAGARDLTKSQFTVLCATEQNEGVSQTALVEITGIDRSTLAEMVSRMIEKGLLSRERTKEDQRANSIAITAAGRKALRAVRSAVEKVERQLLEPLPQPERQRFLRQLATIAAAGDAFTADGKFRTRVSRRRR
ncbi:MAG TPA: MarR family winged helix-turn-helix transcriptional regulator [Rhizomicrobium sp.]|jgi:DNA-binding MarR family transcriptional regulator|nr:MarR family winged helix-turn-helix transcriptional regulator [Rhizomicrobium sp.]HEX4534267.1 MarR family winged helix-turn-helix transcriptional regulator [Rhizomicrobium sp.]